MIDWFKSNTQSNLNSFSFYQNLTIKRLLTIIFLLGCLSGAAVFSDENPPENQLEESHTPFENTWEKIKGQADEYGKIQQVYLDNSFVQSYNNRLGLWQKVSGKSILPGLGKHFGFEIEEFKKINGLTEAALNQINNNFYFLPFSEEYLNQLKLRGITRLELEIHNGEYVWPLRGERVTSRLGNRWGTQHTGLDIAAAIGTIVIAAQDGEVKFSGRNGSYGVAITVDHGNSYEAIYGHLSEAFVKKGDFVKKGQILGLSGNTGRSTGPHLHFEVRCMGMILNPESFLPDFDTTMQTVMRFESAFFNDTAFSRY